MLPCAPQRDCHSVPRAATSRPPITTRRGPRVVVIGGLLVAALGTLWQSRWGAHGSIVVQMVLPSAVFALGGSVSFFATSVLLTSEIDREHSGLGSGLFNAGRQIGGSIGLAVMAVVAAAHARTLSGESAPARAAAGYGFALMILALLVALGVLVVSVHSYRRRTGARRAAPERRSAAAPSG